MPTPADSIEALRPSWLSHVGLLAVLALTGAMQLVGLSDHLDLGLLDRQFALLRRIAPRPAARDVVIVGIDSQTVSRLPEPMALWHAHLGAFLKAASAGQASVIGLDVILPDRSYDFLIPGQDRRLLEQLLALRGRVPVVLGRTVDAEGRARPIYAPFVSLAGRDSTGFALVRPDPDGVVRHFEPDLVSGRDETATLVGRMARHLNVDARAGIIDYTLGAPFRYLPLIQVLEWGERGDQQALKDAFAGRPVLLGTVLPLEDRLRVPTPLAGWEPGQYAVPGVLIHGQTLRSLMGTGLIREVPTRWVATGTVLAALLWFTATAPGRAVAALGLVSALALAVSTWLLHLGWWLPVSTMLGAAIFATVGRESREAALQMLERRRLRGAFGGYVSPQIMDEILEGRLDIGLGGHRRRVCVLFSDIRDFTTRSETMPPEQVIRFLNRHFAHMTAAVHDHSGTVDKFIGDGMMAFFGAPKPLANPCRQALDAAGEMLSRLESLNHDLEADGVTAIRIGIGLCVGDAVIGHVGSVSRHEYTAIGDVVNVASRLEGLTKALGYPVICAAAVIESLSGEHFDSLGEQPVKGHTPVQVYGWPSRGHPPAGPPARFQKEH